MASRGYPSWYLYYRLLAAVKGGGPTLMARLELQDVLVDLRRKAVAECPGATDQEMQDFMESVSRRTGNGIVYSITEMRRLMRYEEWGGESNVG